MMGPKKLYSTASASLQENGMLFGITACSLTAERVAIHVAHCLHRTDSQGSDLETMFQADGEQACTARHDEQDRTLGHVEASEEAERVVMALAGLVDSPFHEFDGIRIGPSDRVDYMSKVVFYAGYERSMYAIADLIADAIRDTTGVQTTLIQIGPDIWSQKEVDDKILATMS